MTPRKKWLIAGVIVVCIASTGVFYAYDIHKHFDASIQSFQIDAKSLSLKQLRVQAEMAVSCLDDDPQESIKGCTALIDEGKKSPKAYRLRGSALISLKRYDEAIQDYTTAFQLDPKSTNLDVIHGEIEDTKNERDKAISYYTSAIEHEPTSVEAYQHRGSDYFRQDQYDLALNDFNHGIQIDSNNCMSSSLYTLRGMTYREKDNYNLALQDFNYALKLSHGCLTTPIYYQLQYTNFLNGDFPAAIEANKHLIQDVPTDAFNVIWLHLERMRAGQDDSREFESNSKKSSPSVWQQSVLAYFAGSMTADELMEKSTDPSIDIQKQQICADNFYIGEVLVAKHDDKGLEYLRSADQTCSAKDTYHIAADAELSRAAAPTGK